MIVPVILAGGSGTRLWPLSRELYPKQLMTLTGGGTMLQNTVERIATFGGVGDPIVICNENHRFMVAEQLRAANINPGAIVLEPVGRNTAPAVAVAAIMAADTDMDSLLIVLPADHFIGNIQAFHDAVAVGQAYARDAALVTFGVVPTAPETGYGYIKKGAASSETAVAGDVPVAVSIEAFVEKPDMETARAYLDSGDYCWNSGMFMFRAGTVLDELERFAPDIVTACRNSVAKGANDLDFFRLDADSFGVCPSDSIDYAVMEKTGNGIMVPFDAGWNDLGSWEALWDVGERDSSNNVTAGDVITHDVKNSYLRADSRLVAAVGLEDHIVVETPDAVLVTPRTMAQDVKHIVNYLKTHNREEALFHKTDYRPWGSCESLIATDRFRVNRLTVKPGELLSLQRHFHRAEHWVVLSGIARVTKAEETFLLEEDQSVYIPLAVPHRLENPGTIPLEVIEVQTGSFIDKADIDRLEDVYGR
ncbi:MAG: mannose-1-phosphate guanylyltransferase/mannose-6-phosphate isomerase [Thermodesulfobacteriota bacterium]|nr:mannose-1-phosphate guanylyltransferase/mannose-6-phosphate isomerase [Thermodesulfobacteriota bacterium]